MSEIKDGGPAFPESYVGADAPHEGIGNGMTLRDYFAAKAMQAMLRVDTDNGRCRDYPMLEGTAALAYRMADAMIEARK